MTYAGLADTTAVLDQDSRAIVSNYVAAFLQVGNAHLERGDPKACLEMLRLLEDHVALRRLGPAAELLGALRARAEDEIGRAPRQ